MIIKELFEGPVGDYCIARNTIKCLLIENPIEISSANNLLIQLISNCKLQIIARPHECVSKEIQDSFW